MEAAGEISAFLVVTRRYPSALAGDERRGVHQSRPGEDPGGWWDESNKQDRSGTGGAVALKEEQEIVNVGLGISVDIVRTKSRTSLDRLHVFIIDHAISIDVE